MYAKKKKKKKVIVYITKKGKAICFHVYISKLTPEVTNQRLDIYQLSVAENTS